MAPVEEVHLNLYEVPLVFVVQIEQVVKVSHIAMIREAKEDQEDYADRFLAEFGSYEPDEEERKLLADELVNDSPTCGYNWLRQFVGDLTELQRCTEKLISTADGKLRETFETLTK